MSYTTIDNRCFTLTVKQRERYLHLVRWGKSHSPGWREVTHSYDTLKREWGTGSNKSITDLYGVLVGRGLVRREGPKYLVSTGYPGGKSGANSGDNTKNHKENIEESVYDSDEEIPF